ncbi:MAG TPA: Ig-like domain-containing protein [Terriglobia bacterium]|nr:Ig-like domain-containing protein [Terriglobia bacterium]
MRTNVSVGVLLFTLVLLSMSPAAHALPPAAMPLSGTTQVQLQSTPNPANAGNTISFTASVSASGSGGSGVQASSTFDPPAESPLSEGGKWVSPINPLSTVALQKNATHQVFTTFPGKDSAARYVGASVSGDQFSQATIANQNGNTVEGVLVRIQSNTDGSCYGLLAFYGDFYTIARINDNNTEMRFVQTSDTLGGGRLADFAVKPQSGDVLRLEISGTPNPTVTAYVNGSRLGSVVDTGTADAFGPHPPLSGGQPGIYTFISSGQPSDSQLANWSGGGLGAAVGTPSGTVTFLDGSTVLGTATLNASGQASFSTTTLSVGTHAITAAYSGDTNFSSSTSAIVSQVVSTLQTQPSTTTVTSTPNPSSTNQAVILTASVSSVAQGLSASSNFAPPAENPLSEAGKWVTPVNAISTVAVQKTATNSISPSTGQTGAVARYVGQTYSGDQFAQATIANRNGSTVEGVFARLQSNTSASGYGLVDFYGFYSLVRMNDYGNYMRFTGTSSSFNGGRIMDFAVAPQTGDVIRLEVSGSPNPTLRAYVNGTLLGTVTDSGQTDAFGSYPPLQGGQPGVFLYMSAGSSVVPQLASWSGGDISAGIGGGIPSGTVTFKDGTTALGTATLDSNGHGSLTTSGLSSGSHSITASYGGNSTFGPSTSSAVNQVVNGNSSPAATATALSSALNPSNVGQTVTFTASVTSSSGTPAGSVTFKDGSTTLGTVPLDVSGHAGYTTSALSSGAHSITAAYAGNASYQASTSSVLSQSVNSSSGQGGSQTTVTSSLNPSVFGQAVTFTATAVATGGLRASSTFDAPAESPLSEGGNWKSPLNPLNTIGVQKDGVTHTITPSAPSASAMARYVGQTYSGDQFAQATISAQSGSTVEGVLVRVQSNTNISGYILMSFYGSFYALARLNDYGSYQRFVGNSSSFNGGRIADFAVTPKAGDVIRLEISGAPNPTLNSYLNGTLMGSVVDSGQTDSFGSYPPLTGGQPGVLLYMSTGSAVTPALSAWSGGDLALPDPAGTLTGNITFKDAAVTIGTVLLDATSHASYTTSALAVGSHSITANYSGDSSHLGSSSSAFTQAVNSATTTTTLLSSLNPSATGQAVTLTATVTATGGNPTGSVTFKDGTVTLGTSALNMSGQASLAASFSNGTHPLTAQYSGDGTFTASSSSTLNQLATLPPTTTTVSASVQPALSGHAITFTAKVSAPSGTPTGSVTFFDGTTSLGTATLSAGVATLAMSSPGAGSHPITATYGGDISFGSSASPVFDELVISPGQARSSTIVTSILNPSTVGQTTTLKAVVSANAGLTASSNFDGPVQNPLSEGGNWTTPINPASTAAMQSDGAQNILLTTLGASGEARYVGKLFLEDQFSQATIIEGDGSTLEGVAVRMQSDTNASAYALVCNWAYSYAIMRMADTGSGLRFANTLATFPVPCNVGHVVRLEITDASNPTLTAYLNGTLLGSVVDTGFTDWSGTYPPLTGGQPGVFVYRTSGSLYAPTLTTWSGGDLNAPSASGTPTGTVTFYDGNNLLSTASLNAGTASFSTSAMTAGSHPVVAIYSGSGVYVGSASSINQVVTGP